MLLCYKVSSFESTVEPRLTAASAVLVAKPFDRVCKRAEGKGTLSVHSKHILLSVPVLLYVVLYVPAECSRSDVMFSAQD